MLFYEPLFATFFLVFFALYLLAAGASAKKWTLLIASLLFYVWGEPVFVLVLLASAVIDYALSLHLGEPTPPQVRRLALTAGIICNLGVLAVYKYADFVIENLDRLMSPFGAHPFQLLHLALPIGVSFVVFD
jgi:alginate O-acetyltransferase complex protein AlgI